MLHAPVDPFKLEPLQNNMLGNLFQAHGYSLTAVTGAIIPVLCILLFVRCVVVSSQRLSKYLQNERGDQSHRPESSLKGVSRESRLLLGHTLVYSKFRVVMDVFFVAEPAYWDFCEIKPHEGVDWKEIEEIPYRPFREGPYFLNMGSYASATAAFR